MADNGKVEFDSNYAGTPTEKAKLVTVEMMEQYMFGAFKHYFAQYAAADHNTVIGMARWMSAVMDCFEKGVPVDPDGKVVLNQQVMDLLIPPSMPKPDSN
jgi:hypothetical protein